MSLWQMNHAIHTHTIGSKVKHKNIGLFKSAHGFLTLSPFPCFKGIILIYGPKISSNKIKIGSQDATPKSSPDI